MKRNVRGLRFFADSQVAVRTFALSRSSGSTVVMANHPFDGGTPLVARALDHDLSLVQTVTVRRRSAQVGQGSAQAVQGGFNPATGGATGGAWPPSQPKRMRMSPQEALDDLANWRPGEEARAANEAMAQFASRALEFDENAAERGQRPEGMVNTYEVCANISQRVCENQAAD